MAEKRIKLIVTGDSEKAALHRSLAQCFPTHTASGDSVVWDTPRKEAGVTSYQLKVGKPPLSSMKTLVNAMFAEALNSKQPNGTPPDLVIVVDDVELGNAGQEGVIVQAFQAAVKDKLNALQQQQSASTFSRIQARIRTACSFHMLCPMVESYFFADFATLAVGGVATSVSPRLGHLTNVEQFDASPDPHPAWQALCQSKNSERQTLYPWWQTERHPKHYLSHLLAISAAPVYHETTLGARMIQAVNWNRVAKTPTDSPIISALLEDIWDWFGQTPPLGDCVGQSSPATYQVRTLRPTQRLLRNI